ncbi:amidase family protein [Alphaproteobacteria bacterium endosymbiont of Tiliacea citrago]|uniref:amidase family protein n=1 Tax=Alphaproteobacteria bacterium endosymbiont of Tiliacea citrago TaxID=3077944 RepID=UPI00313BB134
MLVNLSIEEINLGILHKHFSYKELIQAYFDQFEKYSFLNVHISEYWNEAKKKSEMLDNNFRGERSSILEGIPISIKDMFLINGTKTTAASKVLEKFTAPYESFVTSNLLKNNYIMPFKNNLDEFAMGSSSRTSACGPVVNPWIISDGVLRVPGGSSGGSSSAVAAKMSLGSLGTDTGGSVRQPSSFCGTVGFKPTYGRCSRRGIIAFASSLDHPGIFARNVQDACHIFEAIAGYDAGENTSLNKEVPKLSQISDDVKGKIIGVQTDLFDKILPEYKEQCLRVIKELKQNGAIIKEIELPSLDTALKLYYIIAPAEAASNLARYDGLRFGHKQGDSFEEILKNSRSLFGQEVARRILIGKFVLSADEYDVFLGKALKLRQEIKMQMAEIFESIDAFLLPTAPGVAFGLDDYSRSSVEMYYEDLFTILANMYGGPAIQVPIGLIKDENFKENTIINNLKTQKGLPIGIQVLANCEREDNVIAIAKNIEKIANFGGLE